jgi:hypothetical protein
MNAQRAGNNFTDPHIRIQRCIRVLEDHLHMSARPTQF